MAITKVAVRPSCKDETAVKPLPEWIKSLRNLEELNLGTEMEAADRQDCSLVTALPSDVSSLKVLRKFVADDAFGKQSNASLNALKMPTSLEVVGLNRVHLSSVPVWIFAQKRLKRLTLPYGKLSQLPKDISKLQALEYLDLSMNNLQTLSKEIARIESLRGLDKLSREDSLSIGHSHHLIVAYFDTGASDV